MPWARIDDGFHSNPKVEATSLAARGLLVTLISYAANHLTDGLVPESVVKHHARGRAGRVALHELLERGFLFVADDGAYGIHDYLDYNASREHVEAERAKDRGKKERARARCLQSELPWSSSPGAAPGASPQGDAGMGGGTTESDKDKGNYSRAHPGVRHQHLVAEVMAILRRCSRLQVPDHCEVAVESAIAGAQGKDPIAAAHLAVTWASDPAWRKTWGPSVFADALRKQDPAVVEKGRGGQNVHHTDRVCARCRTVVVEDGMGAFCVACSEVMVA